MTVLSICQDVAFAVGLERPTAVMSSTEREHYELAALANEMASRVLEAHDWELLKTLATYTGDDSTTQFALPTGFDRMPKKQRIWSSRLETPLKQIDDHDYWLELDVRSYEYVIGVWTKIGGQIEIKPAMVTGETAKYYYISNLIVAPETGDNKATFTLDTDTFRLSERLLELGMIWQWKANKGLPYEEDMATYETLLGRLIDGDNGPGMMRIGRHSIPKGVTLSYPQTITS